MLFVTCAKNGRIDRLAAYLEQEKRLREKSLAPEVLKDSLEDIQQECNIDVDAEWQRFGTDPNEWIKLLRKLRSG